MAAAKLLFFSVYVIGTTCFDECFLSYTEAAAGGGLQEKVFLEILQNSKENACARV